MISTRPAKQIWGHSGHVRAFALRRQNAFSDTFDNLNNGSALSSNQDRRVALVRNWLLSDRLGSIRDIVSSTGTLLDHRDWDSSGILVSETGSGSDRYGWTGREWDAEIERDRGRRMMSTAARAMRFCGTTRSKRGLS